MKPLLKFELATFLFFIAAYCQPVGAQQHLNQIFLMIIAGPDDPFMVRSLQVVINDKRLTTNLTTRVKEPYFILPGNDTGYIVENADANAVENGRSIEKSGSIIYRISAKQSVTAVNVIGAFTLSGSKGKVFVSMDPGFIKDCYDVSDFLVTDGKTARLNCMVNFTHHKTAMDGETWAGTFYSDKWGLPEFWWYNLAKIISYNTEYEYWNESSMDFWLLAKLKNKNEPGIIGAHVTWRINLEPGFRYFYTLVTDSLPDYILMNNKKVWDRTTGYYDNLGQVSFTYIPVTAEPANIAFIKEIRGEGETLVDLNKGLHANRLYCTRTRYEGSIPNYPFNPLPHNVLFTGINPFIACRQNNSFGLDPVDYVSKPVKLPGYSAQDMVMIPLAKFFTNPVLNSYIKDLGIKAILANSRPIDKLDVYKQAGLKHVNFYIGTHKDKDGNFASSSVNLSGVLGSNILEDVKSSLPELANEWLGMVPDGTVTIFFHEVNDFFGNWSRDIHLSRLAGMPKYSDIHNVSVPNAFKMHFDFLNGLIADMKARVKPEFRNRFKTMFLFDHGSYNVAYTFKSGADVFINKQIHRQSVNIAVANARGNASAANKEYGFDCDTWDRCFYHSYHPDEAAQIMRVYYHAGGKYLLTEMSTTTRDDSGITALGKEWIDFIKYANRHPLRGTQLVKIGIMRGFDEWLVAASPSSSWESEHRIKEIMGQNYLTDFNLLKMVFGNFGRYDLTATDRLCTGTPYGPVDMIPWDASPETLKKYGIILFLGVNDMNAGQFSNLRDYVISGGTLFMAAGHLKDEKRNYPSSKITDLFGVRINGEKYLSGKPYAQVSVTGKQAEILSRLDNQDPLLIKNRYGEGECYLFTGEHVTEFGEEVPLNIIKPRLEDLKWLSLSPFTDRMEYLVQKKGSIFIFSLFNHGNVGYPSGNGIKSGPWIGSVSINSDMVKFNSANIAAFKVCYNDMEEDPFTLEKLKIERKGNELSVNTEIDKFSEIVIGPAGMVEKEYYRK